MENLLKVVGAIWALIGLGNLIQMPWKESSEGVLSFGLLLNMLLFVIPGLVVYGIGNINKMQKTSTEVAANKSTDVPSELSVRETVKVRGYGTLLLLLAGCLMIFLLIIMLIISIETPTRTTSSQSSVSLDVREDPSKMTSKNDVLKMKQKVQTQNKVSHKIEKSKNSESMSTSVKSSDGAFVGQITHDAAIGCLDKTSYETSLNCIMENDAYCLSNLVAQGRCKLFKKGEIVYIEDFSPFAGMMEIRERGSSTIWKISSAFVKRIKK